MYFIFILDIQRMMYNVHKIFIIKYFFNSHTLNYTICDIGGAFNLQKLLNILHL